MLYLALRRSSSQLAILRSLPFCCGEGWPGLPAVPRLGPVCGPICRSPELGGAVWPGRVTPGEGLGGVVLGWTRDPGGCGGGTPGLLKGAPGLVCPGTTGPVEGGSVGCLEGATPGGGLDGGGLDGVGSPSVGNTGADG